MDLKDIKDDQGKEKFCVTHSVIRSDGICALCISYRFLLKVALESWWLLVTALFESISIP